MKTFLGLFIIFGSIPAAIAIMVARISINSNWSPMTCYAIIGILGVNAIYFLYKMIEEQSMAGIFYMIGLFAEVAFIIAFSGSRFIIMNYLQ